MYNSKCPQCLLFAEMRAFVDLSESAVHSRIYHYEEGLRSLLLYNSDPNNPIFSYNFDEHENLTGKRRR